MRILTPSEQDTRVRSELRYRAIDLLRGVAQMTMPHDGAWEKYAHCRDDQPNPPFPENFFSYGGDTIATRAAIEVCEGCPVRVLCGTHADERRLSGTWGGIWRDFREGKPGRLCGHESGCCRYTTGPGKYCGAHRLQPSNQFEAQTPDVGLAA